MNPISLLTALLLAQTIRVETRVVAIDVLVRDPVTRRPAEGLDATRFRVRVDGKERPVRYFHPAGTERKPLAMFLVLNLAADGALRHLSEPASIESISAALARFPPGDELAVLATADWFEGTPREMAPLSRDRAATLAAIRQAVTAPPVESLESRRGERTMSDAVARALAAGRPDSQVAMVYISDGMNSLETMSAPGRQRIAAKLREGDVSFSSLRFRMAAAYASAAAVINPLGKVFGWSVTGAASEFARETGGIAVEVENPERLGAGLAEVLSAYSNRYSLGLALGEDEYRDGREHKIEVSLRNLPSGSKYLVHARKRFRAPRD